MHLTQKCWSSHKTLPLSICQFLPVPCTNLIQNVHFNFCSVIKFNNFRFSWIAADCWITMEWWKEDNWFVLLWDIRHKSEILGKYKIDEFSSRCLADLDSGGISLLFCFIFPTSDNILFFSWFARSTDVKKLSVVTFRPALSRPEISWTNVQTTSRSNQRATSLFPLSKETFSFIVYFVTQSHHPNFDSVLAWFYLLILPESISSSEWN